jgi:hypothetical protein
MTNSDVQDIAIPYPESGDLTLRFSVGACRFVITPGDDGGWVTGTYRSPGGRIPCVITQEGGTVKVTQGNSPMDFVGLIEGMPSFDLRLGRGRPFSLNVECGAGEATLDLGGVPITRAVIRQGAGRTEIAFPVANPQPMSLLDLAAGAGVIVARELANANAAEIAVEGGAASFKLDFGGTLQRDGNVRISTGMSSVEVSIPASTAARVTSQSLLGNVDSGDAFVHKGDVLWNEAAVAGKTPVITVHTSVAMGSLRLRSQ